MYFSELISVDIYFTLSYLFFETLFLFHVIYLQFDVKIKYPQIWNEHQTWNCSLTGCKSTVHLIYAHKYFFHGKYNTFHNTFFNNFFIVHWILVFVKKIIFIETFTIQEKEHYSESIRNMFIYSLIILTGFINYQEYIYLCQIYSEYIWNV